MAPAAIRRSLRIARFIPPAVLAAFAALAAFTAPAEAADRAVFKLSARDGAFAPSVIDVPAGKRFELEISNDGSSAIEFESRDLKQEKVIPPGAKVKRSIHALKPGEYRFFDEFHEKTGQGRLVAK